MVKNFILIASMVAFPTIILLTLTYQHPMSNIFRGFGHFGAVSEHNSSETINVSNDKLLDGLLASGFDQQSCLSRYQSVLYRKTSLHKPSPYLLSKLRDYENLHKHCGPYTESYNRTLKILDSKNISSPTECNYIVWTAVAGLGNRIISLASAFLYALLTNRILLVYHGNSMADLFCEPFPNTSWLLPMDFPLTNEFRKFNRRYPLTYGNMVKNNKITASTQFPPSILYIFIATGYDHYDQLFYWEEHQQVVQNVPWLILKSDEYFIPSLFLIPSFEQELDRMFPDKETVFHFLGRYLFHPSNKAWGLITRFYHSYLGKADQRIGMQIRVFNPQASPLQVVMDQILACIQQKNLLPQVDEQKFIVFPSENRTSKAILIASLYSEFYENIKNIYWKFPTITGEVIGVYQPSHEEYQHFGDNMHNVKAWVEMNLLSLSDVLVTSSKSTFGYVAQGLGGLKPWILYKPEDWKTPNQACDRAMSMEPCLHLPPNYDFKNKVEVDMGIVVAHVKHCEDLTSGLKLVNHYNTSS